MSGDGTIQSKNKGGALTPREAVALLLIALGLVGIIVGACVLWGWAAGLIVFSIGVLALGLLLGVVPVETEDETKPSPSRLIQ